MGKKKGKKKTKKSCCGKYLKKNKHCSKCPVLVKKSCKLKTKELEKTKKSRKNKKSKKRKK